MLAGGWLDWFDRSHLANLRLGGVAAGLASFSFCDIFSYFGRDVARFSKVLAFA
jgi:hypothetical protein